MISIADATAKVLEITQMLDPVSLPLSSLAGAILAEDVLAQESVPAVPTSIMDGYAVVSSDGPGEYKLCGHARAGDSADLNVTPGTVAYITTGSPIPNGADAVVMIEDTSRSGDLVQIKTKATARQHIREIGSDMEKSQVVLRAGTLVGACEVGVLATVGAVSAMARPRARVAVMSTGNELAEAEAPPGSLAPGVIRDSNRAMLIAACKEEGVETMDLGIARDDPAALEALLDQAIAGGANVLITSGGVSMGDRDLVKPMLERRGTIHFGRVLMKPGKPLTFASIEAPAGRQLLVFGLPGNPVSSIVTFHLAVVPCLRRLAGHPDPRLRRVRVRTTCAMKLDPERPEYHRATLRWDDALGGLVGDSTGGQRSSRLLSMLSANLLLELPQAAGTLPAGTEVPALLIGPGPAAAAGLRASFLLPVPPPPPAGAAAAAAPIEGRGADGRPKIGVLTISDRASAGVYTDVSGPLVAGVLKEYLQTECDYVTRVIPDEVPLIVAAVRQMAAAGCALVVTTGGTGPALRDVTPEAMAAVCDKVYDGFGEEMRRASLAAGVPTAILSRQSAGSVGRTLVINLPGKPAAVRTCLDAVFPAVPYCIDLLGGPRLEGDPARVAVFRPPAQPK